MPAKPRAFLLTWPGAYHSRAVSYTHLDVYKRQDQVKLVVHELAGKPELVFLSPVALRLSLIHI